MVLIFSWYNKLNYKDNKIIQEYEATLNGTTTDIQVEFNSSWDYRLYQGESIDTLENGTVGDEIGTNTGLVETEVTEDTTTEQKPIEDATEPLQEVEETEEGTTTAAEGQEQEEEQEDDKEWR